MPCPAWSQRWLASSGGVLAAPSSLPETPKFGAANLLPPNHLQSTSAARTASLKVLNSERLSLLARCALFLKLYKSRWHPACNGLRLSNTAKLRIRLGTVFLG